MDFAEHTCVELAHDLPHHGLREGDIGTVVHVYREGEAYEVEFITDGGQTTAVATLVTADIRKITPRPKADVASIPPAEEERLRKRVEEQLRFEESGDVSALCEVILPAYRSDPKKLEHSAASFHEFVKHVESAELVSFTVESWLPRAPRFGGAALAVVRSAVRYNDQRPTDSRTIWVYSSGKWHTTAVGKFWFPGGRG